MIRNRLVVFYGHVFTHVTVAIRVTSVGVHFGSLPRELASLVYNTILAGGFRCCSCALRALRCLARGRFALLWSGDSTFAYNSHSFITWLIFLGMGIFSVVSTNHMAGF